MTQRVLVTGGAGFIGAALVVRLLDEGHRVVVLDNMSRGRRSNLESVIDHEHLHVVEGDVVQPKDVQACYEALGGIDLVHHLAAVNGTKWFDEAAVHVIDVNINGTLSVLRHAQDWGARLVLASSPEAFGDADSMPLRESHVSVFPSAHEHQRFSYGASKYLDEVALMHAVGQGLDGRIVRPFNAYGPQMVSDAYGQVVGMMFQAVLDHRPITVHGDGQQTRSFTWIDDIVDGFYLAGALDQGVDGSPLAGCSFNLGSTEEVSMLTLAHTINEVAGSLAVDIVMQGGYPGDSRRRVADCSEAERRLGWRCRRSLQDGLHAMWSSIQP